MNLLKMANLIAEYFPIIKHLEAFHGPLQHTKNRREIILTSPALPPFMI